MREAHALAKELAVTEKNGAHSVAIGAQSLVDVVSEGAYDLLALVASSVSLCHQDQAEGGSQVRVPCSSATAGHD